MATAGVSQNSIASTDPGATLHTGRISALRDRMGSGGRAAALSLGLMGGVAPSYDNQPEAPYGNDPVANLNLQRHQAKRYANPSAMMPNYSANAQDLASDQFGGVDESLLDEENSVMSDIADESSAADDLSLARRARSRLKGKADELMQQGTQKASKEFETFMAKVRIDATAKGASALDDGWFLEIVDTLGTGVSVAQAGVSIFEPAMSPEQKETLTKVGLPPLNPSKAWDIFSLAGTVMQAGKWGFIVTILLPYAIIFILLLGYSACREDFACGLALSLKSLLSSIFGT